MGIFDIIGTAIGNSQRSKLRTTLTVVAIFIGAFTLTITSAIGAGISHYIDTQVAAVSARDVLSISKAAEEASAPSDSGPAPYDPGNAILAGGFDGDGAEFASGVLSAEDLTTIRRVDGILDVSPVVQVSPRYVEHGESGKFELTVNFNAALTTPVLAAGSQLDGDGENQLLLVTSYLGSLGFADAEAAIGQTVTIGVADYLGELHTVDATVAGVQNTSILANGVALNQTLTDALHDVETSGMPTDAPVGSVLATAHFDPEASAEAIDALKAELADLGYSAQTVADQIGLIQTVISGIIGVLNAFAIIALIAAGFGIINTLLMSVQERTREIGLMKAMGMGGGRIYALFSVETVFIGLLGSMLGAIAAIGTGYAANAFLADTVLADLEGLQVLRFDPVPVGTILLLVMFIAFLAGTLPARRAARQNPIDALRYE